MAAITNGNLSIRLQSPTAINIQARPRGLVGATTDYLGQTYGATKNMVSFYQVFGTATEWLGALGFLYNSKLPEALANAGNIAGLPLACKSLVAGCQAGWKFCWGPSKATAAKVGEEALKFFAKLAEALLAFNKVGVFTFSAMTCVFLGTMKTGASCVTDLLAIDDAVNNLQKRDGRIYDAATYQLLTTARRVEFCKAVSALLFHGVGFVSVFLSLHIVVPVFIFTGALYTLTTLVSHFAQSRFQDAAVAPLNGPWVRPLAAVAV